MKCKQARALLAAYEGDELSASERKLVQAHLAGCAGCREELAGVVALEERLKSYLHGTADRAAAPAHALSHVQARLREPGLGRPQQANWWSTGGVKLMKGMETLMRRPALGIPLVLVVVIALTFSVPAVRAQMQAAFSGWAGFTIPNSPDYMALKTVWDFTPYNPTRMPEGLRLRGSMTGGDTTTSQFGLLYQPQDAQAGDPFVQIIQTHTPGEQVLPEGERVNVRGQAGIAEELGPGYAGWHTEEFPYTTAQRVTWYEGDVKIEITGTYPLRELLAIAKSMRIADVGLGEKAPTPPGK